MNRKRLLLAGAFFAPLALIIAACGNETTRIETPPDDAVRGITVSGEGKVTAKPDLAMIQLGVSVLAPTVAEARTQAATSMDAIIASMKSNGIDEKDIQTTQIYINAEYDYSGNTQTLRGFRVNNTVSSKIREIDDTSKVIDDAVNAGGNNTQIQGISFTIDKPETLQDEAREKAVGDAKARAETLARAAGVSLGGAIAIVEGATGSPPIPYAARAAGDMAQEGGSTPILTGELDVIVTVTVTWAIE